MKCCDCARGNKAISVSTYIKTNELLTGAAYCILQCQTKNFTKLEIEVPEVLEVLKVLKVLY